MSGNVRRPEGALGFVAPLMLRPLVQTPDEEETVSDLPPTPIVVAPIRRRARAEPTQQPQNPELTREDKKTFVKSLSYFLSNTLKKSSSDTVKNLSTLVSLAKKAGLNHVEGKPFDETAFFKALLEIGLKNELELKIAAAYPHAYAGFKFSELMDICRVPLQEALAEQMKQNCERHQDPSRLLIRVLDGPFNNETLALLLNTVYAASYVGLEVGSWPSRITSWYAKESVNAFFSAGKSTILLARHLPPLEEKLISIGKTVAELLGQGFKAMNVADHATLSVKGRAVLLLINEDPNCLNLRSETGQEQRGECELYDQLRPEENDWVALNRTQDLFDPSGVSSSETNPPNRTINANPKNVNWPNPFKPHPITERVGGSFYISGGSNSPPQYHVQVSVIVAGPKNLPYAPSYAPQTDPNVGAGATYRDHDRPTKVAYNQYASDYSSFKTKETELQEALAACSPDDSPDDVIQKSNKIIKLAKDTRKAASKAIESAYDLHTNHSKKTQRKKIENKELKEQLKKIDEGAKKILRNEFETPYKLKKGNLPKAKRLVKLNQLEKDHENRIANARKEKDILKTAQEFDSLAASVQEMERSDGSVDPDKLSDYLAKATRLGAQLIEKIRNREGQSPEDLVEQEQKIKGEIAKLTGRSYRHEKIDSKYSQFRKLERTLLSQIKAPESEKEASEGWTRVKEQKAVLERQIDELIAQTPDDQAAKAKYSGMKKDVASRYSYLSVSKMNNDMSKPYNQFCEKEASIDAMENSDGSVDLDKLSIALAEIQELREKVITQFRLAASQLPQNFSEGDLKNNQEMIEGRMARLTRRDARFEKIVSDYDQLCELGESLLPQLVEQDQEQAASEDFNKAAERKAAFDRSVGEFIAQDSDPKRAASLLGYQKEIALKFDYLAFCLKSLEEKSLELLALRTQIQNDSSSPEQHQKARTAYLIKSALLCDQLTSKSDHANFFAHFSQFADYLKKEESLTSESIDLFSKMSLLLINGVQKNVIKVNDALPLVEAVEKKCTTSTPEVDQIRLTIGRLLYLSDGSTDTHAMKCYQRCSKIEPQNPLWPKALAIGHLQSLKYSESQQAILTALSLDPENEETKKAARVVLLDKYNTYSLVLEGFQLATELAADALSPKEKEAVSKIREYANTLFRFAGGSLNILNHPTLLKRWLPAIVVFNSELKERLLDILSEEKSTRLNIIFNGISLAARMLSGATGVYKYFAKDKYPKLEKSLEFVIGGVNLVQTYHRPALGLFSLSKDLPQLLRTLTDRVTVVVKVDAYALLSCLSSTLKGEKDLPKLEFSAITDRVTGLVKSDSFVSTHLPVMSNVNLAASTVLILMVFRYGKEGFLARQKASPRLYTVIGTLGSKEFGLSLTISSLIWRSSDLVARFLSSILPVSTETVETTVKVGAVGCAGYGLYQGAKKTRRRIFSVNL